MTNADVGGIRRTATYCRQDAGQHGFLAQVNGDKLAGVAGVEDAVGEGGVIAEVAAEDLGAVVKVILIWVGGDGEEFAALGEDEEFVAREDHMGGD